MENQYKPVKAKDIIVNTVDGVFVGKLVQRIDRLENAVDQLASKLALKADRNELNN